MVHFLVRVIIMDYLRSFGVETGKERYDEEAVYSLALIYNIIHNEVSAYLKNYGLSPAKFNVLMTIKHQGKGKGISQVDISKRLIVTASNMTRLLDKLEKEKLVERFAQADDRRVNLLHISARGSSLLEGAWPGYVKVIERLAGNLSAADQKQAATLLSKWLKKMV